MLSIPLADAHLEIRTTLAPPAQATIAIEDHGATGAELSLPLDQWPALEAVTRDVLATYESSWQTGAAPPRGIDGLFELAAGPWGPGGSWPRREPLRATEDRSSCSPSSTGARSAATPGRATPWCSGVPWRLAYWSRSRL